MLTIFEGLSLMISFSMLILGVLALYHKK